MMWPSRILSTFLLFWWWHRPPFLQQQAASVTLVVEAWCSSCSRVFWKNDARRGKRPNPTHGIVMSRATTTTLRQKRQRYSVDPTEKCRCCCYRLYHHHRASRDLECCPNDDDDKSQQNHEQHCKDCAQTIRKEISDNMVINRRDFVAGSTTAATLVASASMLGLDPTEAHAAIMDTQKSPSSSSSSLQQYYVTPQVPPFSSVRRYKTMVLSNGLRVLLVSDKRRLQLASAALTIGGAGQFSDPTDLPGLAHLMEHMILGSDDRTKTFPGRRSLLLPTTTTAMPMPPPYHQDLEDWLSARDGSSNGYTAYDNVCFHFFVNNLYFQETLQLFASLFVPDNVERVCRRNNDEVLRREISRVDSELDMDRVTTQAFYLTKNFVNSEHPYSRFGLGNRTTLEQRPRDNGIDVSHRLLQFFYRHYQPSEAVLVVMGTQDISTMARWVSPFAATLSPYSNYQSGRNQQQQQQQQSSSSLAPQQHQRYYPGRFLQGGNRLKQMVLARKQQQQQQEQSKGRQHIGATTDAATAATGEVLTMEWILNLDYTNALRQGESVVSGTQIAFLLSQILGRRLAGSLYFFLLRRGWVTSGSLPRFSVPVDVSGFQLLKLEIVLTVEGFLNRSAVVVAVLDSLDALREGNSYSLSRVLITSWATVAKLFGYTLANRAPDVIELAQDAQVYGFDAVASIGTNKGWYRFPSPEDRMAMRSLSKSLVHTLDMMSDPDTAVVTVTAGPLTVSKAKLPPVESRKWNTEPTTGGRFLYEEMIGLAPRFEELVLTRVVDREELLRPVLNTLVPLNLRTPRIPLFSAGDSSATTFQRLEVASSSKDQDSRPAGVRGDWFVGVVSKPLGLPLRRGPPEPTCRCALVIQLLSSRPARAGVRQAAQGELFKTSFENALSDLGELGAPGGLAYDVSYNKYGMRIAILGLSQNVGSYTRRICRRLVEHATVLFRGSEVFPRAITNAAVRDMNRFRGISPIRKSTLVSSIRRSTAYEAAAEGIAFLGSVDGAVCFGQGDLLPNEVQDIARDVREILYKVIGNKPLKYTKPAYPDIQDLVYMPVWKPRFGSPCGIAGVALIADACGRVPR